MEFQKNIFYGWPNDVLQYLRCATISCSQKGFILGHSIQQCRYVPPSPHFFQHKGLKCLLEDNNNLAIVYQSKVILNACTLVAVTSEANSPFFRRCLHSSRYWLLTEFSPFPLVPHLFILCNIIQKSAYCGNQTFQSFHQFLNKKFKSSQGFLKNCDHS